MLAFGLTIALFSFWGLIGCAVVRALRTRMPPLQEMLLAPVVGVVLTIVPVFVLNRAGFPVVRFGYPLTIALLVAAGALAVLAQRPRPFVDLPWRDYAPFALTLLLALLLTGRPMLEFGLHWVSFCNDDMANYCLGAVRFHDHGFFEVPALADLMRGSDYSLFYWFFHVPGMGRTGSELFIAWVMTLTGLSPHQVFMPLILAFHLCQVSAAGALLCRSPQLKAAALAACLMLAGSPLASFGALYQLNSQVIGLALLAGAAAVLLRPSGTAAIAAAGPLRPGDADGVDSKDRSAGARTPEATSGRLLIRQGLLVGLLMSGLFVLYPEVLPILGLSWVIYVTIQLVRRKTNPKAVLSIVGIAAATGVVLLWRHVRVVFVFVFGQATAGSTGNDVQNIFYPFYLLPSGLADLWGFFPLTRVADEPVGSGAILLGGILLVAAAGLAVWLARREQPVGIITIVMIALGMFLFFQRASFGLYKLAMFIQPFLMGTMALAWLTLVPARRATVGATVGASGAARSKERLTAGERWALHRHRLRRFGPLMLLALPGLFIQQGYVQASRGRGQGTGFGELPDPSATQVNADFRRLLRANNVPDGLTGTGPGKPIPTGPRPSGLVADSYNIVLAKFQSVYTRGTESAFPSTELGTGVIGFDPSRSQAPYSALVVGGEMYERLFDSFPKLKFDLHEQGGGGTVNEFTYRTLGPEVPPDAHGAATKPATRPATRPSGPVPLFVGNGGRQAVFNRWHGRAPNENFFAAPLNTVRNHLLFQASNLGKGYYLSPRDIAMYQLEPDPTFMVGSTMSAAGRHLLFEVLNPSPRVRMVLECSTSLRSDGDNALPPAAAVGAGREYFPMAGRGSARVFSPPLRPQVIGGRSFVALDMGRDAGPFPMYRRGLMKLYGSGVSLDWRRLVAFARDISVVNERQYVAMKPPDQLQYFPKDLQNPQLQYSGMYEDGWLSDRAWIDLGPPWNASALVIKGNVPDLGNKSFQTEMTVLVDGEEVARRTLGNNWFEMTAPMPKDAKPQAAGRRRVEFRFSKYQNLAEPDLRPVTFQIGYLGFETAPAPPPEVRNFPADLGNAGLEARGLDADGWVGQRAALKMTQPADRGQLVVAGMVPDIAGAAGAGFKTTLRVKVDGKQVVEQALGTDRFSVRADVPPATAPAARLVELEFDNVQRLPAPDTRTVACRLTSIAFEAQPMAPTHVERFPDDVRDPLLRAAGLFEDGWAGQSASVQLRQPAGEEELSVRGMVPLVGTGEGAAAFRTELAVRVDGREVGRRVLEPGQFDLVFPALPGDATKDVRQTDVRRVELQFSETQPLTAPDSRRVGARLTFLGFDAPEGAKSPVRSQPASAGRLASQE